MKNALGAVAPVGGPVLTPLPVNPHVPCPLGKVQPLVAKLLEDQFSEKMI